MLVPPLCVAALGGSEAFVGALDLAGTYGITVLFGLLPALMALQSRNKSDAYNYAYVTPSGNIFPILIALISCFVVAEKSYLNIFD